MHDIQNDHPDHQIITAYGPIFREKLKKLERRGKGHCAEADKLRKALARIDRAMAGSRREHDGQQFLAAAE